MSAKFKEGLYRIWCGVNRLGDSGVHTLGDTSAFVSIIHNVNTITLKQNEGMFMNI